VWLDRAFLIGLAVLVVFSPIAIGSVNPWAFGIVEMIIFGLIIVWMACLAAQGAARSFPGLRSLLIPAALFIALIIFQLLPMPAAIGRMLSPATYRLYAISLPGWPYSDAYPLSPAVASHKEVLPSAPAFLDPVWRWRPIAIAPSLATVAALKLLSYIALFFVVVWYPLRADRHSRMERRFCRRMLKIVLVTGLIVGCIGLVERAFWNGAILWFYVPYDWGQPRPESVPRATGPFVNPDHFAAYLNLILPMALAGMLSYSFLSRWRSSRAPFRLFCLAAASVLTSAIALSLSRGGWIAGLLATSIVVWGASLAYRSERRDRSGIWLRVPAVLWVGLMLCLVAGAAFYEVPAAPTAVDARLEQTVADPDFSSRIGYWRDALAIVRDFPVFGVGLGCFQDVFPRYQSPPWQQASVREAHNDYIELAADTGIMGFGLALWFCIAAAVRLRRGLKELPDEHLLVAFALLGGLAAMGLQEFFDFPLQIPANAVLFTILLGIAVRLCRAKRADDPHIRYPAPKVRLYAGGISVAAVLAIVAALRQDMVPYPYLTRLPRDDLAAKALIREHPARSGPHLWYAALQEHSPGDQLRELAIAASLEPNNPLLLDSYAQALAANGSIDRALAEVTRSVFVHPSMADHFYLQPDMIPWLSFEERQAIDTGLSKAVAHNFSGAGPALATFYASLHHDAAEADLLAKASSAVEDPIRREKFLLDAGAAYARAGETSRAAAAFRQAASIEPSDPEPYQELVKEVFAPRKDTDAAKAVIQAGVANGADPFTLYMALGQVYERAGDLNGAEAALAEGIRMRPDGRYDYDTLIHLAELERRAGHLEKTLLWMRNAIQIRPSPGALYQLAVDEEADYEYGPALRDLNRALSLSPGDAGMKKHYGELMRMIAAQSDRKNHGPIKFSDR
jgi:tetratricopeptide (TPR) repeat protein